MKVQKFKAGDRVINVVSGWTGTVTKKHKLRNNGYTVRWDQNGVTSPRISPLNLEHIAYTEDG